MTQYNVYVFKNNGHYRTLLKQIFPETILKYCILKMCSSFKAEENLLGVEAAQLANNRKHFHNSLIDTSQFL